MADEVRTTACDEMPPLLGHAVALTGHRRSDELAVHLEQLGASTVRGPVVRTRVVEDAHTLRAATRAVIERPPHYLVATTGIGMRSWLHAAASSGERDELLGALRETRVLARGPKVVGALSEAGLHPWFVEPSGRTEPLVDLVTRQPITGLHVVFQLPGAPMEATQTRLLESGASVTSVAAYDWTWPEDLDPARRLLRAIAERRVSVVTFTSRPAVHNLHELAQDEGLEARVAAAFHGAVVAVCVGDVTADAFRSSFGASAVVPERPLLGAVVQATADAVRRRHHHHVTGPTGEIVVQGRLVVRGDDSVMMSDREAQVLDRLLVARRRTVPRDELLSAVWLDEIVDSSVLETTMTRLRRRLAQTGLTVRTVNGRGYQLVGELTTCPRHDEAAPALV